MAVAVNTATSARGTASTLTFAHTTAGANKYLIVGVALRPGTVTVNTVTYAGVSMTRLTPDQVNGDVKCSMWELVAPAASGNVVITMSAAPTDGVIGGAVSFTGVDQTTPSSGVVKNATVSVTVTSVADDFVIDAIAVDELLGAVGAGQTQQWNLLQTGTRGAGSTEPGAAPSVVMSWASGTLPAHIGVNVKAAAAGGPFPPWPQRVFQSVLQPA
mgnify:CR=1 FL=1